MVVRFTRRAVSNALLWALTSPMVPRSTGAADVYLFGDDALRGDMIPSLALEAPYWLFLAFGDGDSLMTDRQSIDYCSVGRICVRKSGDDMGEALIRAPSCRGLDPPNFRQTAFRNAVGFFYFFPVLFAVGVEAQWHVVSDDVVRPRLE